MERGRYHADVEQERPVANLFKVDDAHQLLAVKHDCAIRGEGPERERQRRG
jgi:hypothetical protein